MKKMELVAAVADKAGVTRADAQKMLEAFTQIITDELKEGGRVSLMGFGSFETSDREAREGKNPRTGEVMQIKATRVPRFKAAKALKDAMNVE